jgi:hypothetical protein
MADLPEVPEEPKASEPKTSESVAEESVVSEPAVERPGAEEPTAASDDEVFAQLVADFDAPVDAGARSWPAAEDIADLAPQPRPRPAGAPVPPLGPPPGIRPLPRVQAIPPVDPRAWTPEEDPDDEHFVPPPPPPLPRTETPTRLAVAAVVGGVMLALAAGMGLLQGMAGVLGVGLFVGGVATLIARMRNDDDDEDDDDPQRGAVV